MHQSLDLQTSRYSDETVAISEKVFAVSKVKTLENLGMAHSIL